MRSAFAEPGGETLRAWIDSCPNQLYSALCFQGGAAFRRRLLDEIGDQGPVSRLIEKRSDAELLALMSNLGGHDMETVLDAFERIDHDRPVCFIAYTIKGVGLPFQGHKDNHAGLMTPAQMEVWRTSQNVRSGHEWDPFEGMPFPADEVRAFLARVPFAREGRRRLAAAKIRVPERLAVPASPDMSTQQGFGLILQEIARRRRRARRAHRPPPRPTSPSRPTSDRGSIAAACSPATRRPICSRRRRFPRPSCGNSRRVANTSNSASPR